MWGFSASITPCEHLSQAGDCGLGLRPTSSEEPALSDTRAPCCGATRGTLGQRVREARLDTAEHGSHRVAELVVAELGVSLRDGRARMAEQLLRRLDVVRL